MGASTKSRMHGRALSLLAVGVLALAAAVLAPMAPPAQARSAALRCDLIAAPGGRDSAPGTLQRPLATPKRLVSALAPGETGCLRAGDYDANREVSIDTPGITLTSYPGERATLHTRLWIEQEGDGVTISRLDIDGRNPTNLPSPTVNADDVVIRDNDITNHHTAICISLGSPDTYGRAARTLIEHNRVHDCGKLPPTNQDHGIYVNSSDDAVIRDNRIFDNADRGVQLYPDSQRTLLTHNVIDGNGVGVIFGGSETTTSNDNVVQDNVITNSKVRGNIDYSWGGAVGTGNIARHNCLGGEADRLEGVLGTAPFRRLADATHLAQFTADAEQRGDLTLARTCARVLGFAAGNSH
jgi:parallel beta-helix repeat protein